MKTIKPITFVILAALMTTSPAFTAESQSWGQRLWTGIWNAFQRTAEMQKTAISRRSLSAFAAGCVVGAALAVCEEYLVPKAKKIVVNKFVVNKIASNINNELKANEPQFELLKLRLQEAATGPHLLNQAFQQAGLLPMIGAAALQTGIVGKFLWDNASQEIISAVREKLINDWNIRLISPAEAALFAQKVQKAEQNLQ